MASSASARLVAELRANSARFAELWDSGAVGRHVAARKTIDHPDVGPLQLDCDVLTVAGSDLHLVIYTAEPGTEDAERLALLTVLGTQTLVGQPRYQPVPATCLVVALSRLNRFVTPIIRMIAASCCSS